MTLGYNLSGMMSFYQEMPEFKQMSTLAETMLGTSMEDLVGAIGGSFVLNVNGFEMQEVEYEDSEFVTYNVEEGIPDGVTESFTPGYGYKYTTKTKETLVPLVGLSMDVTNMAVLDKLIEKIPEEMIQKEEGYYAITLDDMPFDTYLTMNSNTVLLTNDKTARDNFLNGGYSDHLGGSVVGNNAKDTQSYMFMNLNYDTYPQTLKSYIEDEIPYEVNAVLRSLRIT